MYELIGLNYSLNQIIEEYPHLKRSIILKILEIGKEANKYLTKVDIEKLISKEV